VLDIFRKTAPAFEVALRLGRFTPGEQQRKFPMCSGYSEALGIAYQIRDDLSDLARLVKPTTSPACVEPCSQSP